MIDLYAHIGAIQNALWQEVFFYLDADEEVDFPQDDAMYYNSMDEAHSRLNVALSAIDAGGSLNMSSASTAIQDACDSLAVATMYAKKAGNEHGERTSFVYWLALDFVDDVIVGS
jgi:hypothetical protein